MSEKMEQLLFLRAMTERTGALHEAQLVQLKHWPYVAMPHLKSYKLRICLDVEKVSYECTFDPELDPPSDLIERWGGFQGSVHQLLGPRWILEVSGDDGNLLYEGDREK